VEPVLGTLINFLNMKRVNTRGIRQANKHVLMAAMVYNLKKYMKFSTKILQTGKMAIERPIEKVFSRIKGYFFTILRLLSDFIVTQAVFRKLRTALF